jgi:hypothetical protein
MSKPSSSEIERAVIRLIEDHLPKSTTNHRLADLERSGRLYRPPHRRANLKMSNDLVVQLGAKLDQFASDMNQAGDMADSAV